LQVGARLERAAIVAQCLRHRCRKQRRSCCPSTLVTFVRCAAIR
jgi:hypothetical protein